MDILLGWLSIFLWTRPNAYADAVESFADVVDYFADSVGNNLPLQENKVSSVSFSIFACIYN